MAAILGIAGYTMLGALAADRIALQPLLVAAAIGIATVAAAIVWPSVVRRAASLGAFAEVGRSLIVAVIACAAVAGAMLLGDAVLGSASHVAHSSHALSGTGVVEHAMLEMLVVGPLALLASLGAEIVVRATATVARAWRAVPRSTRRRLLPVGAAIGALLVGPVVATSPATAAIVPAAPACTAATAVRSYDIAAVNVFIPYSRWVSDARVPRADPAVPGVQHLTDGDDHGMLFVLQRDKAAVQNWHVPIAGNAANSYAGDPADGRRLRPRPLVLRANVDECIEIRLTNELDVRDMAGYLPQRDPRVSLHAFGVSFNPATSSGAAVGYNPDSSVPVGESRTYYWVAPKSEGMYTFRDNGMPVGAVDDGGAAEHGLYGALAVEPAGSRWFDPVTGRELSSSVPDQQYAAVADQSGDLYIDAVIADAAQRRFRESVLISQDILPTQDRADLSEEELLLLPEPFERFGINLGSDPEPKRLQFNLENAQRWCEDCSTEETALSSWVYGDPGMVKLASGSGPWLPKAPDYGGEDPHSRPGGLVAENIDDCGLMLTTAPSESRAAPCHIANVTRAYQGDPIKLRFGHAGNYETHVFHLHAHTWPAEPDDLGPAGSVPPKPTADAQPRATTIDSKTYSPWTGFTADLNYGAGARVGTIGDSIFHCHLYTHFSHGFWALMRVHDVFEDGTNALPDGSRVGLWQSLDSIGADLGLAASVPPAKNAASFEIPGYPRFIPGEYGARAPQPPLSVWQRNFDPVTKEYEVDASGNPVDAPAMRLAGRTALDPAALDATQDIETDAVTGVLSLTFAGETAPVDLPATAADVEAALESLESIDDVVVEGTGVPGEPWRVRLVAWRSSPDLTIGATADAPSFVSVTPSAGFDPADADTARLAYRLAVERNVQQAYHGSRGTTPVPGSPLVDPCPADAREVTYRVSIIQLPLWYTGAAPDGWRDVQGRILVLDEDVDAVLSGQKAPEPFFYRVNSGDCINFELTNRAPNVIGDDAYQQLLMTNMAGSHIHLVNFDVLASDGASNGWNYQQAAFSQDQAEYNTALLDGTVTCTTGAECLPAMPAFRDPVAESQDARANWLSQGQTIKERWFADYELRTVFNHDHHFAGSIQNRGLFSALIVEPAGFDSRNPYSGEWLQPINRADHAAASGKTVCTTSCVGEASGATMDMIGPHVPPTTADAWEPDDFREFGIAIADFVPVFTRSATHADILDPVNAVEPPHQPLRSPEGDQGGMAINYRATPLIDRQFAGTPPAPPDQPGVPVSDAALAAAGWVDPAYAFSSRVWGDPHTPVLRLNRGDSVRFRLIQGSHEEMHNFTVHGLRWKNDQADPASPYINARPIGVSEAFNIEDVAVDCGLGASGTCFWPAESDAPRVADFLYGGPGVEDLWFGVWGIMRVFDQTTGNAGLLPLPDNAQPLGPGNPLPAPDPVTPVPQAIPTPSCPTGAPVKRFDVSAIDHSILYNRYGDHDPYGLAYVLTDDVDAVRTGEKPLEPLVLRVNEGDCIEVDLHNEVDWAHFNTHGRLGTLDGDANMPLEPVWPEEREPGEPEDDEGREAWRGVPWIAGNRVSLHPSLVRYDVRTSDGTTVGYNFDQTAGPGESVQYTWYADEVVYQDPNAAPALTDGELGVVPLLAYGDVRGTRHHGLLAALVVGPPDAIYRDPVTGVQVHSGVQVDVDPGVDGSDYRDAVIFQHNGLNVRDAAGEPVLDAIIGDWPDKGERAINYRNAPLHHRLDQPHPLVDVFADPPVEPRGAPFDRNGFGRDLANVFSSTHLLDRGSGPEPLGDPDTPIIRAYQGDPLRMHVVASSDRARTVQYAVYGHNWLEHAFDAGSVRSGVQGSIATGSAHTFHMEAAGGALQAVGDYRYGVENGTMGLSAGSWGIVRVYQHPAAGTERVLVPLPQCGNPFLGCNPLRVINESLTPEPGDPVLDVTAVPTVAFVGDSVDISALFRLGDAHVGAGHEITFTWLEAGVPQTRKLATNMQGRVAFPLAVSQHPPGSVLEVMAKITVAFTDGRPPVDVHGGVRIFVPDPSDTTGPVVQKVKPADGAADVPRSTKIVLAFSERLDPATLDGAVRLVGVASGEEIPATVTESHSADILRSFVTLQPTASLRTGRYRVEVDATVTDHLGNALVEQFTSTFVTVGAVYPRLGGVDRYETSVLISQSKFAPVADTVYVTTGAKFPDALSGGPAAAANEGPILLVGSDRLPTKTAAELQRLMPLHVKVLGDAHSISDAVVDALRLNAPYAQIERVAGPDRYATAAQISLDAFPTADRVYVANGLNFPDALAAGTAAAQSGSPILLVTPTSLPEATRAELERLGPDEVVIIGDAHSVSPSVAFQIGVAAGVQPQRLAGSDRYQTAARISAATFPEQTAIVYLTSGARFPDALSAGPVAGLSAAPILLIPETGSVPMAVLQELQRLDPAEVVVLGDEHSISAAQLLQVREGLGAILLPFAPDFF